MSNSHSPQSDILYGSLSGAISSIIWNPVQVLLIRSRLHSPSEKYSLTDYYPLFGFRNGLSILTRSGVYSCVHDYLEKSKSCGEEKIKFFSSLSSTIVTSLTTS